jgi:dual oxidase
VKDWTEINPVLFKKRPELLGLLAAVYANRLDNVDLYVGGMLESRDGPGELFRAIIKEQFTRIRDADRFWFENTESG